MVAAQKSDQQQGERATARPTAAEGAPGKEVDATAAQRASGRLVKAEERGTGAISMGVYKRWVRAGSNYTNFALITIAGFLAPELLNAGSQVRKPFIPKLAQKLGQLQPFIPVFPQECMGHLAPCTFWANLTASFLAADLARPVVDAAGRDRALHGGVRGQH